MALPQFWIANLIQFIPENAFSTGAHSKALEIVSCNLLIFQYFCFSSDVPFNLGPLSGFDVKVSLFKFPSSKNESDNSHSSCSAAAVINSFSSSSMSTGLVKPAKKVLAVTDLPPTFISEISWYIFLIEVMYSFMVISAFNTNGHTTASSVNLPVSSIPNNFNSERYSLAVSLTLFSAKKCMERWAKNIFLNSSSDE